MFCYVVLVFHDVVARFLGGSSLGAAWCAAATRFFWQGCFLFGNSVCSGTFAMDHTLSQLQALLDEAERTQTSVSASSVGRLQALASQAARLGSGSYLAIEYRAIFPLLELPGSVVSLILSHLPAARLAACMPTCRAFQRHLGEAAISMRLTRLEQVLPTVQPGEAVTHALRFAEMLAASPPATLGAGESHTLCLGREGVLLSCGGDYLDDDQRWPFVGHLGHGQEWGEAVARSVAVRLPAGVRARAVAGGGYVSLCLSCEHEAWSWGGYGCGHGLDAGNVPRPKRLPLPMSAGVRVALLACGSQHCLLLDSEGQIWASGRNLHGELGVGDTQPRPPAAPPTLAPRGRRRHRGVAAGLPPLSRSPAAPFASSRGQARGPRASTPSHRTRASAR